MHNAYLLIGSNMGNRWDYLLLAQQLINEQCGHVTKCSSVYETAAWGITNQASFYNQTLLLNTELDPELLMTKLLAIEEQIGRKRMLKYGPRIIDIDMLFYDEIVWQSPLLTIPHPLLQDRKFALLPLDEIASQLVHPVLKKTVSELLKACADNLDVQKISLATN